MLDIHVTCDGCGETEEYKVVEDLKDVFDTMKDDGWRTDFNSTPHQHYCVDCKNNL